MRAYRSVLRPRWLVLHLVAVAATGSFVLAGVWQLHRSDERRERNRLVAERRAAPEAPLEEAIGRPGDVVERRVRAAGRYDTGEEVLLLGRGSDSRPGNHVLTPLVTASGRAIVVDRGWVPPNLEEPPVPEAAPPDGEVVVHGVLLASEGTGGGEGQLRRVARIDVGRLAKQLPYPTYSSYLLLRSQEPVQREDLPEPVPLPPLSEGPHLFYAVQWFLFAAIATAGYPALLRREVRHRTATT